MPLDDVVDADRLDFDRVADAHLRYGRALDQADLLRVRHFLGDEEQLAAAPLHVVYAAVNFAEGKLTLEADEVRRLCKDLETAAVALELLAARIERQTRRHAIVRTIARRHARRPRPRRAQSAVRPVRSRPRERRARSRSPARPSGEDGPPSDDVGPAAVAT